MKIAEERAEELNHDKSGLTERLADLQEKMNAKKVERASHLG